ncbi:MAG TPA: GMC family oxidoreductase [Sphingomicrobium sp.]|nr:GMC family oxidoreductase [Sphingomicrobium sp.]
MLIDLRNEPGAAEGPFEICIVGAGAAGITLARKLSRLGHEVCLLESGGLDYEAATQQLYEGANVGMPYYELDKSRLRFFGGTVAIWGGRCALMDPIDFEPRSWVPHSGWPIRRTDLDPFYREAHRIFDLERFNYEEEVWKELGLDDPGLDPAKLDVKLWRFDELSERFTADRASDLFEDPRVRILLHANVVKLQASPNANSIDHIAVQPIGGKVQAVRAKHYVLAAGAIENSRLLLVSNDVERHGVGNKHNQVGRFFMEHPAGRIARIDTRQAFHIWSMFQKRFVPGSVPLAPALRLADEAQRDRKALNSIVTFKLQRDPSRGVAIGNRIYQNVLHSVSPNRRGRMLDHLYRGVRAWIHREVRSSVERWRANRGITGLYAIMRGEQAPNPESRVLLSGELDALGNRRADLDWQMTDIDKHTALVMAETIDEEFGRLGWGSATPSAWLSESGPRWPVDPTVGNHPLANYHQLGGTRMSSDPAQGVVDSDCRVHGYANLHVAGGSVFTTSGWANPTLTIVALALRLADRLDRRP